MEKFYINGGNKLYGRIKVDSAKNAILPIMAGSIMCKGKVVLKDITYYEDVKNMIKILKHLGVGVEEYENVLILDPTTINNFFIPEELTSKLRASIFFLGPLLSALKRARVAYPGGCAIGARPIDIHLNGLSKMGAKIIDRHGIIYIKADNLKASSLCLPFPSVGATENLIMASIFVEGHTAILGVAKEPEVVDLCNFLNKMGAKIYGAGTDEVHIYGVESLSGGEYTPMPDRIIAGTYLLAPLICGGEVEIQNINPEHIRPILDLLNNNTCKIYESSDKMVIEASGRLNGFGKIETMPYPFFPTDLQQPFCALSSVCNGNTVIVENLFENRTKHVPELSKMGAKIIVKDRAILIEGTEELFGASVVASDLRGGASLVLAGLKATGYTTISNIHFIDRGYYMLDKKLASIGAEITRIST